MKKLILIAAATISLGCASMPIQNSGQENIFRSLGIPAKFLNYEKNELVNETVSSYDEGFVYLRDYSDGKINVRESRDVHQIFSDGIETELYPSMIVFDLNENFIFEKDEVLIDENADGINGNETWLRDLDSETRYSRL